MQLSLTIYSIPRHIDVQLDGLKQRLFNPASMAGPDLDYEYITSIPDFPTPPNPPHREFPTLGDRIGAAELSKRNSPNAFTRKGFVSQAIAAGWHHKSQAQLTEIAEKVGRERIMVLTGGLDNMITPPHGFTLRDELNAGAKAGEAHVKWVFLEDKGHVPVIEARELFNSLIEEMVEKGETSG